MFTRRSRRTLLSLLFLLLLQSCSSRPKPEIVSFKEWRQQLAAQEGHVVVVAVWASWCANCVDTLSSATQIAKRYSEQGVTVTSLCLNDTTRPPEVDGAKMIIALQPEGTRHFLLRQVLGTSLDALSLNDIPAVLVVDTKGEIRHRIEADSGSNQVSLADLEDAIESLL